MAFQLVSKHGKDCPHCGAELSDCALGWVCPTCKTFVDMDGGEHQHQEKPFMPPARLFDKVTANPVVLSEFIAGDVLGFTGTMYKTSVEAWRKALMQTVEEE